MPFTFPRMICRLALLVLIFNSACAPAQSDISLSEPSPTNEAFLITPVESAFAPGDPTSAPHADITESKTVPFDTPDGVTITGELYGSGDTAVIFSVMGNCKPGWREFAQILAEQEIAAFTYQWRGCGDFGSVDEDEIQKFVDDLRGAIAFMREQGAKKIILVGASLGGCASAKLAAESEADGLIVIASPPEISQWGFKIDAADLDTDIPKLFITAENDNIVPSAATRELFNLSAEPKEWQAYAGTAHGTDLFDGEHSEALTQRLLQFILDIANKEN